MEKSQYELASITQVTTRKTIYQFYSVLAIKFSIVTTMSASYKRVYFQLFASCILALSWRIEKKTG